jgi:hypothetical protein
MLIVPVIYAESSIDEYVINESILLSFPCFNDGKPCLTGDCYLTLTSLDNNIIILNDEMNKTENIFSYNYTPVELGLYKYIIYCEENDLYVTYTNEFIVLESDVKTLKIWTCSSDNNYIILIIIYALAIFFLILSLWISEPLIGVLAGLIITFSYLYIGACSPLLFLPILVIGILITTFFGLAK